MKDLKTRIRRGETLFGCWLNMGSSVSAEIVGSAGFDWVLIDFEHGTGSEQEVRHQLQALGNSDTAPVVRVESHQRQRIHRMLDLGAEGIMVPRIENPEEADLAARALRYQPEGSRGIARMVRAAGYGADFSEYIDTLQDEIVGIIQVETTQLLDHLDKVASIEGVDVLFVGPMDLSAALGVRGDLDNPVFLEAAGNIARAASGAGKAAGILISDPGEYPRYSEMGYRFIACGSDTGFVLKGAFDTARNLKRRNMTWK